MSAEPAAPPLAPCPHCGAVHGEAVLRCPIHDRVLPLQGRLLAGKFRLLAELGRGGMGSVWRARNVAVDRDVALKLILPEVSRNLEVLTRFQNEARVAARIGHPGICDILDLVTTPLGPVIVMELLRGESLGERLEREGRLPVHLAVTFVREALAALEAAHRAGVIHRDLKPENLFLHRPGGDAVVVKLMDFGISKFKGGTAGALTAYGAILGTPEYMAPEQVGGAAQADVRTDIWAIGAVLYRAITGTYAFTGATFPATVTAILTTEPAPLEAHVPGVPPGLSAVVLRCLAKKPDARFQSARELADALEPYARPAEPDRAALASAPTVRPGAVTRVDVPLPASPAAPRPRARWPMRVFALALLGGLGYGAWCFGPGASPNDAPTAAGDASSSSSGHVQTNMPEETSSPPTEPPAAVAAEPDPDDAPAPTDPQQPPQPAPDPAPTEAPPAEPPRLIAAQGLVTPTAIGKVGNQRWAREYCSALHRNKYLGIGTWKLANPAEAKKFTGVAGLHGGGYWTTAVHRGRGLVVWLPRGTDTSVRVTKKVARPLCVAPQP